MTYRDDLRFAAINSTRLQTAVAQIAGKKVRLSLSSAKKDKKKENEKHSKKNRKKENESGIVSSTSAVTTKDLLAIPQIDSTTEGDAIPAKRRRKAK